MNLFDSSALLSYLLDEPGGDAVRSALADDGVCSAANWSETCQKVVSRGRGWTAASTLLLGRGLTVVPVTADDAVRAAELWVASPHLSLGDRLCLATADRLDAVVWTADAAWGDGGRIRQIRAR